MKIETGTDGDVQILAFDGPVRLEDVDSLRKAFRKAVDSGGRRFVFDLSRSAYMDSASVGEVVVCLKRARSLGGGLKLVVAPEGKVGQLLKLCMLDRVFELFDDQQEAVRSFSA